MGKYLLLLLLKMLWQFQLGDIYILFVFQKHKINIIFI